MALAETLPPLTAVELINVPYQRDARLSPDGKQILFLRYVSDWDQDRRVSHVWKVGADGAGLVQMTNGKDGESSPRWSPDGQRFIITAKRDCESNQIFIQAVAGGEAFQLSEHETGVSEIAWSPDGGRVYFLADDADSKAEKQHKEQIGNAYSFDRNFKQRHLWVLDVETRSESRVTDGDFSVHTYSISRDGEWLAYCAGPTPLIDDTDESEVWLRKLGEESDGIRLTHNLVNEKNPRLSPDGKQVLFIAGANQSFEGYYQDNLFMVPAAGGEAKLLIPDFPGEVFSADWSADGSEIIYSANQGVTVQLYRLDLDSNRFSRLTEGNHSFWRWHYRPETGSAAWIGRSHESPGDVHVTNLSSETTTVVTSFADEISSSYAWPRVEAVTWQGRGGVTVEGLLTYPIDYVEGTRYPVVAQIHGGPAASTTYGFPSWVTYTPLLAAHGYAVLNPNYRGSTGYGDDFLRDMVGHYFNQAHLDVLAGIDALVDKGIADPKKLAIMGWSAGGHMTNWMVTHTDRFAAASSGAGASNWISMYGQSDVRIYRTPWFLGTPWQKDAPLKTFLEHSPITRVSQASTPTLILVGENDLRVPMPQSVEMFRGLRANGVETELIIFPDQPHGLRSLKHQLHKVNSELAWFERHLFNRVYESEKPPQGKDEDEEEAQQGE
jgi:dipeptidyl aminopeptidase/acylaminoacyl peptidase